MSLTKLKTPPFPLPLSPCVMSRLVFRTVVVTWDFAQYIFTSVPIRRRYEETRMPQLRAGVVVRRFGVGVDTRRGGGH